MNKTPTAYVPNFLRARQYRAGGRVDLAGVPQLPEDVAVALKRGVEPTDQQERRANRAIREACREIKRRLLESAKANPVMEDCEE